MHQAGGIRVDTCGCEKQHIELDIELDSRLICEIQEEVPVLVEYMAKLEGELKILERTIPVVIEVYEPIVCGETKIEEHGVYLFHRGRVKKIM